MKKLVLGIVLVSLTLLIAWAIHGRLELLGENNDSKKKKRPPAPVEVALIEQGSIAWERVYSGTLEATHQFTIAPRMGGTVKELKVDIGDTIERGQIVALLDDAEAMQVKVAAEADLAVANARLFEATKANEIAIKALESAKSLYADNITTETELDAATANALGAEGRFAVATAEVTRAEAALEAAKLRLGYAKIKADWIGGSDTRVIAERYVNERDNVSTNQPIFSVVQTNPIKGTFFVTEKEYSKLKVGQLVEVGSDLLPNQPFKGKVMRIAPVFRRNSRQARIELEIENDTGQLKPGAFIRVTVVLDEAQDASIIPEQAITKRAEMEGIFQIDLATSTAHWIPIEKGIQNGSRVQVSSTDGSAIEGPVAVLGIQLIEDESPVRVSGEFAEPIVEVEIEGE